MRDNFIYNYKCLNIIVNNVTFKLKYYYIFTNLWNNNKDNNLNLISSCARKNFNLHKHLGMITFQR